MRGKSYRLLAAIVSVLVPSGLEAGSATAPGAAPIRHAAVAGNSAQWGHALRSFLSQWPPGKEIPYNLEKLRRSMESRPGDLSLLAPVERLAVGARSKRVKALAVALILREMRRPDAETVNKNKLVKAVDRIAASAGGLERLKIPMVAIGVGRALEEHKAAAGMNLLGLAAMLGTAGSMGLPIAALAALGLALSYVAILGLRTDQPATGFLQTLLIGGFFSALAGLAPLISWSGGDVVLFGIVGILSVMMADVTLRVRLPRSGMLVNLVLIGGTLALIGCIAKWG